MTSIATWNIGIRDAEEEIRAQWHADLFLNKLIERLMFRVFFILLHPRSNPISTSM